MGSVVLGCRWIGEDHYPAHRAERTAEDRQTDVRVVRFNRDRAGPDISQEEPSNSYNTTETGFREGSSLEEVVEKQADLIDYLKQHNTLLSKRLLNMTVQH
ncbi:transmembrane protein 192-like [Oncorhynchus keta]|uniref:transmembrane protein 192-like n=1 Tax=Oncorhynchus keta TaxID=8018 RepID=UPI00227BC58A|nr:transmembrane protein 192-like [Oncorhynchus keta]